MHVFLRTQNRKHAEHEPIRIQAARQLLSHTHKTLAEIAQETGFTNQSHFTRCFRESTELTPGEYRIRFRKAV